MDSDFFELDSEQEVTTGSAVDISLKLDKVNDLLLIQNIFILSILVFFMLKYVMGGYLKK
ncbi:hypothetical protein [Clostridium butyricum]|uniref:Uncharacterized protein n=1 Tax=Clostridium butyricum TaxID=1492 RepID=A0AAP9UGG6_CLOBU|nr:hypothetical protein [Clostridium butyricum]MBZ5748633.1 hypothetical protein [Clostridium butyricum]QMW93447.1 hypothetical protein FF104_21285 [Clostridium butyricum]BBK79237.1 hypothetical protein Cbu04g_42450 [Clostridium butyricum]GEQ27709.1 hypothetical protein CBU03nite_41320 [Clostridium butyricum]